MNSFTTQIIKKSKNNEFNYNIDNIEYLKIQDMLKQLDLYRLQQQVKQLEEDINVIMKFSFWETIKV